MKKILLTIILSAFANAALADSTTDMVDALLKKGVLTEEEADGILKGHKSERKAEAKEKASLASNDELPIKFYGIIRTFVDHDDLNTAAKQPDARVTNFISKFGVRFKEPINLFGKEGWVVNGQYETSWQTENPRLQNTFIGDQQSTIGIASNYLDSAAEYKIDIGRRQHSLWQSFKTYGIFGDAYGTPNGEIHARQGMFFSNGIYGQYKPSYLPGLTLNIDYSLSEKDGVRNKAVYGGIYNWSDYSIGAYRFDDQANNVSNLLVGSINMPAYKSKLTGMISDDEQTGGAFPTKGIKTRGYSTQLAYKITPEVTLLPGLGYRDDGVKAYTFGVDYAVSKRATLQLHAQRVVADNPIIFTTANDIGPLFGINGGSAAATATTRTQVGAGIVFVF